MDAVINQLAHITGASRKQVIEALNTMKSIPEVSNYLDRKNLVKSGGQKKPNK